MVPPPSLRDLIESGRPLNCIYGIKSRSALLHISKSISLYTQTHNYQYLYIYICTRMCRQIVTRAPMQTPQVLGSKLRSELRDWVTNTNSTQRRARPATPALDRADDRAAFLMRVCVWVRACVCVSVLHQHRLEQIAVQNSGCVCVSVRVCMCVREWESVYVWVCVYVCA